MTDGMWKAAHDDITRIMDEEIMGELMDRALQTCACLVYLGEESALMAEAVPARVLKLHPSQDVTFQITDPAWKARLGWGPGAHVEIQVHPYPDRWIVDHFCWQEVQGPPEWES